MTESARVRPTCRTRDDGGRTVAALARQRRSDLSDLSDRKPLGRRVDLHAALAAMREVFRRDGAGEELLYELYERAGFLEFDCGMDRGESERQAFGDIVNRKEHAGADLSALLGLHWPRDFDGCQENLAFPEIIKKER